MTRMAKYIMLPASDVIYNPVNGVNLNMAAAELTQRQSWFPPGVIRS